MIGQFIRNLGSSIAVWPFLQALFLTGLVAGLLGMILYNQAGRGNQGLAFLLPPIAMGMVLVTTVVASSIAIAIGLLGALSLIRFRVGIVSVTQTVWLLAAMATGLAGGTGYLAYAAAGLCSMALLLTVVAWIRTRHQKKHGQPYRLQLQGNPPPDLFSILESRWPGMKVVHVETGRAGMDCCLELRLHGPEALYALQKSLQAFDSTLTIRLEHAAD